MYAFGSWRRVLTGCKFKALQRGGLFWAKLLLEALFPYISARFETQWRRIGRLVKLKCEVNLGELNVSDLLLAILYLIAIKLPVFCLSTNVGRKYYSHIFTCYVSTLLSKAQLISY